MKPHPEQPRKKAASTFKTLRLRLQGLVRRRTAEPFAPSVKAAATPESRMREGFERGAFQLFYQSKHTRAGQVLGAEALMRWFPPDQPPIPPAEFIPLAEATGFILTLGQWLIQTACRQLAQWERDSRFAHLQLAINVSALQFHHPDFVEQLAWALRESGTNANRLKLELTEDAVLKNPDLVMSRMEQIKALGVQFSLDDFGTGTSSLSELKRLRFDEIKIDRSFVRDLPGNLDDAALVTATLKASQLLGMQVCAEGVEHKAQADFLRASECELYQGHLFSRPLALKEFEAQVELSLSLIHI